MDEQNMNILDRIHASYYQLTAAERKVADYVLQQYEQVQFMSITQLAEECGMSVSGFAHQFKKEIGVSPREYILQQRLSAALFLLENTDSTVSDISRRVGFEDNLYFSKFFRKQTGYSPSEYYENFTE